MVGDGGESGDDFGGGLDASKERRDEDAVESEGKVVAEVATRSEGSDPTRLDERWVPRSRCSGDPHGFEEVDAITVTHYDDVLVRLCVLWRSLAT